MIRVVILDGRKRLHEGSVVVDETGRELRYVPVREQPIHRGSESRLRVALDKLQESFLGRKSA